jgi:dienelactone hydrolase
MLIQIAPCIRGKSDLERLAAMNRLPVISQLVLPTGIVLLATAHALAQDAEMVHHFNYDRKAPIDIKQIAVQDHKRATICDITYASPKGGVVPAYLVVPKGKGPFPAVIWGHWYWENSAMRNRKEFFDEATVLAQADVLSLLPDGPVARPGHVTNNEPLNEQQITDIVQAVVDMRRGLDLLLARDDVDPKRIAFVGHSYHASAGGILSGVDRRFKAFVLMAGSLSDEVDLQSKEEQEHRKKVGPQRYDVFVKKYAWIDPGKYVAHAAPAFVFLQYGKEKFFTPERIRAYEKLVSEPKRLKIYDAPHALNAEARRDRVQFLTDQLKLKPLPTSVIASIPELYQPPEPKS